MMKKTVSILGLIGAILIAVGTVFKTLHWPGAGIAITIGAAALALYSFFYMYERLKESSGGIEKTYIAFFGISGILLPLGFLFKMQHWPGAGILIYSFFAAYVILVILSILRAVNEKDKDLQYKYTNNIIWLIGGIIILAYPIIAKILG